MQYDLFGHVSILSLANINVSGPFSTAVCSLSHLMNLDVFDNSITDTFLALLYN
jgi:hypothetical protein